MARTDPPAWVTDAVVYQIFPDRFARSPRVDKPGRFEDWDAPPTRHGFKGGDLLGIVEHLDHLVDLGVNTLSLNPIFASAANHRYHTYDYRQVDPLLGGNAAFRELLDTAHDRGLRVILDSVLNHASRGFWPFHHVLENGSASPYVDWFVINPAWLASGRSLRAYPEPHGSASPRASDSLSAFGYRAWWDLPALPKLNTDNPEVREFLLAVAEHWTRFGADGWRLDVATEIETPGFWPAFRDRVHAVNEDAYIVAEVWDERPDLLEGSAFDGLMNYPLLTALVGFAAGPRLDTRVAGQHTWLRGSLVALDGPAFGDRLDHVLAAYRPAARPAMLNILGSHDTPRLRTMGGGDRDTVRLALVAQMTLPGVPCIYYGDEVGLEGEMDPGSRGAFPWDPGAWDREILALTRDLVAFRRAAPVLRMGAFRLLGAAGPAVAYLRTWSDGVAGQAAGPRAVLVALNNGESPASFAMRTQEFAGTAWIPVALPGMPHLTAVEADRDGGLELTLPPRAGVLLRRQ